MKCFNLLSGPYRALHARRTARRTCFYEEVQAPTPIILTWNQIHEANKSAYKEATQSVYPDPLFNILRPANSKNIYSLNIDLTENQSSLALRISYPKNHACSPSPYSYPHALFSVGPFTIRHSLNPPWPQLLILSSALDALADPASFSLDAILLQVRSIHGPKIAFLWEPILEDITATISSQPKTFFDYWRAQLTNSLSASPRWPALTKRALASILTHPDRSTRELAIKLSARAIQG